MAVVLPHGALFRVGKEGEIRKKINAYLERAREIIGNRSSAESYTHALLERLRL